MENSQEAVEPTSAPTKKPERPAPFVPWDKPMQRADKIIVGALAFSTIYHLIMLPLFPALVNSHPALLEFLRGSTVSIINMGARAATGEASLLAVILLALPSLMMIDWAFYLAGKRWGDKAFLWLMGGQTNAKTTKRLERLHRIEKRFGSLAVVLAYFLPIPSALVYAAVGDGGMKFYKFFVLDLLGTLLWIGLFVALGYQMGESAVQVAEAIGKYSLWITLGLIVGIVGWQSVRAAKEENKTP